VHRARYVGQVNEHVQACFADMMTRYEGGGEIPELVYRPTLGSEWLERQGKDPTLFIDAERLEERYLQLLTTHHDREIAAGATQWGIHKDDVSISLNGRPARLYASQGQQRSLALAMKLAEGWISARESGGDMPVFLFDDVLSELDAHRRAYLVGEMKGRQVIMTACDPAATDFGNAVNLIHVEGGRYTGKEV
jgi:recombinational DNA repair ATPase RecF